MAAVVRDLALLIDGDQVPADGIEALLERLGRDWRVDERICVRNWRSTKDLKAWQEIADEHGIRLIQNDPVRTGKNASDIELAIIMMDLLHAGRDAFCLVSGDTDFTPVVKRIKRAAAHIEVVQPKELGRAAPSKPRSARTPPPSKAAARPQATKTRERRPTPSVDTATTQQKSFAKHVRRAIDQMKKAGNHERGWVSVNRMGSILAQAGHRREAFGFAKSRPLRQILEDLGFEVMQIETGAYRTRIP